MDWFSSAWAWIRGLFVSTPKPASVTPIRPIPQPGPSLEQKPEAPAPRPPPPAADPASWMQVAQAEMNQREVPGPGNNPRIVEYLAATTVPASMLHDSTPWCAGFVSWVLVRSGKDSLHNAWAAAWMNYGDPSSAIYGAIAARQGHVGFVVAKEPGRVKLLGGNQGDAVSEAWFDDKGWAYRWPKPAATATRPPVNHAPGESRAMRKICATGPTLPGIDVSHYQGAIDWPKVKAAGCGYAFIKATEGLSIVDRMFATNWAGAKAAGIPRGAYHFFRPTLEGRAQARYMAAAVGALDATDLPCVLDLETLDNLSHSLVLQRALDFLDELTKLTGRTPIIYTGPYFMEALKASSAIKKHPLWVAHYQTDCPLVPGAWDKWTFWQTSGSGRFAGIAGPVDLNSFDGSAAVLEKLISDSIA